MSKPAQKAQVDLSLNRQPKISDSDTRKTIQQLDDRLRDLSERFIPPQPYLLSVPSAYPYRYSSRFFNSWYIGTPFTPDEEQLQYLSFLSHQNQDEELLNVLGGWADEQGNFAEQEPSPTPGIVSAPGTPLQQPSRKKISLKDYKSKDKTKENTPVSKPDKLDPKKQVMKSEARDGTARNVDLGTGTKVGHKLDKAESQSTTKGSTFRTGETKTTQPAKSRADDQPSPRKRRKLDTEDSNSSEERTTVKKESKPLSKEVKSLPPMLSPTLPSSEKPVSRKELPKLLSPALPPTLEKAVAKFLAEAAENSPSKKPEVAKAASSIASDVITEKKSIANSTLDNIRGRSDSQLSTKSGAPAIRIASPQVKPLVKAESRPTTPLQNGARPSPGPRQSKTIILKYGKKNRKRVDALLRFSRSKKPKSASDEITKRANEPEPIAKGLMTDSKKSEAKRPAEPSPELPVKKHKTSSLLETPERTRTPNNLAAKSPVPSNPVAKPKEELATPKRDLKPSAMQRVASSEGFDAKTPPIGRNNTSTPLSTAGTSQTKLSPVPSSLSGSREDRTAWTELKDKYFAVGRALKREGAALAEKRNDHDQALSVVVSIEATLCFMINLAAQSHIRPNSDPGWSSMFPYQIQVSRASRKYRHLHGLMIQLGAVCRQIFHNHNIDRLSRDSLPDEHCGSAPTPGSDGTTKTDDPEKYKKRYIEFRDQLVSNSRELQSAWLDGSRHLSPYLVERDYPTTWSKRTKDTTRRGMEKLNPVSIGKEFYLPLDTNSTVFEAMRFSLSLLEEWTLREKIQWKTKIEL